MKRKKCAGISVLVGLILVILGLLIELWIFPTIFKKLVISEMALEEGTYAYDAFLEPPAPVYMKFFFFNVENAEEILAGGKPNLTERGPYAYREYRTKENMFEINGDTLLFEQRVSYVFDQDETDRDNCFNGDPESPRCTDQDEVLVLNAAIPGIVGFIENSDSIIIQILSDFLLRILGNMVDQDDYKDNLFTKVKVDELLFKGYDTGILKALFEILDRLGIDPENPILGLPEIISEAKFGIFKGRNDTTMSYQVNNGRFANHKYAVYDTFNGQTKTPREWWPDVAPTPSAGAAQLTGICRDIIGTDGLQYHQFIRKDERLWLFNSDLCRSIWIDFDEEVVARGVKLWRFRPPKDVFDMRNKFNYCYCPQFYDCVGPSNGTDDEWNVYDCFQEKCIEGVLQVGGCFYGAPVIMTAPHFFNCYPDLAMQIEGMNPDRDLHDTTVDIEPYLGISMSIHKRVQINMDLKPNSHFTELSGVRDNIFPVFWLDEGGDIDKPNADEYNRMLRTPVVIVKVLTYLGCFVFGMVLLFGGAFWGICVN